jgi:hypothetical protein
MIGGRDYSRTPHMATSLPASVSPELWYTLLSPDESTCESTSTHRGTSDTKKRDGAMSLTMRDRKSAVSLLYKFKDLDHYDAEDAFIMRELQVMLVLHVKVEIQSVDKHGDIAEWLDRELVGVE